MSFDPIQDMSCAGIYSWISWFCTFIAPAYNSSNNGLAVIIANKWSTRITLTSIFSTLWVSSTDHWLCYTTTVSFVTISICDSWYLYILTCIWWYASWYSKKNKALYYKLWYETYVLVFGTNLPIPKLPNRLWSIVLLCKSIQRMGLRVANMQLEHHCSWWVDCPIWR